MELKQFAPGGPDKHIEVIVRQMMRWVKIEDVGQQQIEATTPV